MRRVAGAALLALGALGPGAAGAACELATSGIAFGAYGPLDEGHRDSRGQIEVVCSAAAGAAVSYAIRLSGGLGGGFRPRSMGRGGAKLGYNLFVNPARSQIWGDGNAGTEVVAARFTMPEGGGPVTRSHPVYGRLFARQSVPVGAYSDAVQATLQSCAGTQCRVETALLEVR